MRQSSSCASAGATIGVLVTCAALAMLGISTAGCAHGESAADRQMAQLREEVARVQSERDKFEQRMNALEIAQADQRKLAATPPAPGPLASGATATPKLKVVHLSPGANGAASGAPPDTASEGAPPATANDDPDDNAPRPQIKVTGSGAPSARARNGGRSASIEQTVPDDGSGGSRPSAIDPDAKKAYDTALALVNQRKYAEALDAFAAFLVKYPDHPYADNAMYWRGECYFAQGDYARASDQFDGLVARFPLGNKAPDALLKLGICAQKMNNLPKAKTYYEKLAREFPRSEAARRIPAEGR